MIIRKATESDLDTARALYDEAREYFRQNGIDQWQHGYPEDDIILSDIRRGECYLCEADGGAVAVFVLTTLPDPSYTVINDGSWLSDEPYVALHRVAVSGEHKGRGIGSAVLKYIENSLLPCSVSYIRGDTHEDNVPMQRLLLKNGFARAGSITLAESSDKGAKRIAFDKSVK